MRDPHLPLEHKIGQLFIVGFQGREPDADTRALLDEIQPGGFLLYQRNIESFEPSPRFRHSSRSIMKVAAWTG
jgi:beta-N-acetylhexosaminidase